MINKRLKYVIRWLLKKIIRKIVIHGGHKDRTIDLFSIIVDAVRDEFNETDKIALDDFLCDCHKQALNKEDE